MTKEEVIYCLTSYQPDAPEDMCEKCPYYFSETFDENTCLCKSREARKIAIEALNMLEDYKKAFEDMTTALIDNSLVSDIYNNRTDDEIIMLDKALEIINKHDPLKAGKEQE